MLNPSNLVRLRVFKKLFPYAFFQESGPIAFSTSRESFSKTFATISVGFPVTFDGITYRAEIFTAKMRVTSR